jgi:hypothetical protein
MNSRPSASRPAGPGGSPVLMTRGRARAVLGGLLAFTLGFAVAGLLVLLGRGGTPPYLAAVTIGFAGVGLTGFALGRGPMLELQGPIWGRSVLRSIAGVLELPGTAVVTALYLLGAIGIVGNIVAPLLGR